MPIKTYRPTTQTLRYRTTLVNDDITTKHPHKPLVEPKPRTGGRRNSGDTTMRFIGGGHKRKLRIIDFKRDKTGIPATVTTIEYDPNRSSRIALLAIMISWAATMPFPSARLTSRWLTVAAILSARRMRTILCSSGGKTATKRPIVLMASVV